MTLQDVNRTEQDLAADERIMALFDDNYRVYGVRKMWKALNRQRLVDEDDEPTDEKYPPVVRCAVARRMTALGLRGAVAGEHKKPRTTIPAAFAPLDDTGDQLLFRLVAAAYERRALGIASHWSFEDWGRFLPEHTTAVSLLDRLLHHPISVVTSGQSYRMREAKTRSGGTPRTN